ncbi:MAG: ACT domain-containing protein [Euryarchaeota archaeon]|nr:ACT domain-containing protein [Euryarchaeota archaeon]
MMRDLWKLLDESLSRSPAQRRVARLLFSLGLRVSPEGIFAGEVRVAEAEVARRAGVDRRAVVATVQGLLGVPELAAVFTRLWPTVFLKEAAPALGLGVVEIVASDASEPGILQEVAKAVSDAGISIRQAIADDPYLAEEARLTLILEGEIPGEVLERLRRLPQVKSVVVHTK